MNYDFKTFRQNSTCAKCISIDYKCINPGQQEKLAFLTNNHFDGFMNKTMEGNILNNTQNMNHTGIGNCI